jgi:hypothetical protein
MMLRPIAAAAAALFALNTFAVQGPSSSQAAYLVSTDPSTAITSIITTGDAAQNGYRMAGVPDGLGAFDNGDGSFTVLMNHELTRTYGINNANPLAPNNPILGATTGTFYTTATRSQGGVGAFVSSWVIDKNTLQVKSGADLMQRVYTYDGSGFTQSFDANVNSFSRFCSADLAAVTAFYNPATGLGTQSRIFLNGEEDGSNPFKIGGVSYNRGLAHVATGADKGSSYILPWAQLPGTQVGYENFLANPNSGDKTVVMGNSDGGKNGLWVYIGNKSAAGNDIEKAGLVGGQLLRVAVDTSTSNAETLAATGGYGIGLASKTGSFSLISGDATAPTGTTFLRPEDGAWDLNNKNVYYFVTTSANLSSGGQSRLWKMTFSDVTANPTAGGKIELLLDGTEGQEMFDNMTVDADGNLILLEDPGNNNRGGATNPVGTARVWKYNVGTKSLITLAQHDPARFDPVNAGTPGYLTQDEESSGVIEITGILGRADGKKYFLLDTQNHVATTDVALMEGGQLMIMAVPEPETNLMMLGGLGLLGLVARRRKAK